MAELTIQEKINSYVSNHQELKGKPADVILSCMLEDKTITQAEFNFAKNVLLFDFGVNKAWDMGLTVEKTTAAQQEQNQPAKTPEAISIETIANGVQIYRQNGEIIKKINGNEVTEYTYNKTEDGQEYVTIKTPTSTTNVLKIEDDGTYLDNNFINSVSKNSDGNEVIVSKDVTGRIIETVIQNENESTTTIYNTDSVYMFNAFKEMPQLKLGQIAIKDGKQYFAYYDENGNTITHAKNGDSVSKLTNKFNFQNVEEFYALNPAAKDKGLLVGQYIVVPNMLNADDERIISQGNVNEELNKYSIEQFRTKYLTNISKEVFNALNKVKGFELNNDNVGMYFKFNALDDGIQKFILDDIQYLSKQGKTPDEIKEYFLQDEYAPQEEIAEGVTRRINLYDGFTLNLRAPSCESMSGDISIKSFVEQELGLDISKGEGKKLYDALCNVSDGYIAKDIEEMFSNIKYRSTADYKKSYNEQVKAYNAKDEGYRKSILGRGDATALRNNKPLTPDEAKEMYKAVITKLTAPEGTVVTTKYDNFINNHKDAYLREFTADMVAMLHGQGAEILTSTGAQKDILQLGKYVLAPIGKFYDKKGAQIYDKMQQDCYLGNDKLSSTLEAYSMGLKTAGTKYDKAKIKKCYDVFQNPKATEAQKKKAMEEAFGYALVNTATELAGTTNFIDGVTDMVLLLYGTGAISKVLTKGISLASRGAKVTTTAARAIKGGKNAVTIGGRLLQVGTSAVTFATWDSFRYTLGYYTNGIDETQLGENSYTYWEGLGKTALHSAAFGAFAGAWGQLATSNLVKLVCKNPESTKIAQKAMSEVSSKLGKTSSFTSSQLLNTYQAAQQKAMQTFGKEVVSFASETIGFSLYEIGSGALSGDIKIESIEDIGDVLWGQTKNLLSFKAMGRILFMHKSGKIPESVMKLGKEKELHIEPKNGVFEVKYPDGKVVTAESMQEVVGLSNAHYENITLYEPLKKVLAQDGKVDLGDGIVIKKGENGYTIELPEGRKVESKDLKLAMQEAQGEYQLYTFDTQLKKDGKIELPNKQVITLENNIYMTKTESGKDLKADSLKGLLQLHQRTILAENIEKTFEKQDVVILGNMILQKAQDGNYNAIVISAKGEMTILEGKSVEEVLEKLNSKPKPEVEVKPETKPEATEPKADNNEVMDLITKNKEKASRQKKVKEYFKTKLNSKNQLVESRPCSSKDCQAILKELGYTDAEIKNIDTNNSSLQIVLPILKTMKDFDLLKDTLGEIDFSDVNQRAKLINSFMGINKAFTSKFIENNKYCTEENIKLFAQYIDTKDVSISDFYKTINNTIKDAFEYNFGTKTINIIIDKLPLITELYDGKISLDELKNIRLQVDYIKHLTPELVNTIKEYNKSLPDEYKFGVNDIVLFKDRDIALTPEKIQSYITEAKRLASKGLDPYRINDSNVKSHIENMKAIADMLDTYDLDLRCDKNSHFTNEELLKIAQSKDVAKSIELLNSLKPEARRFGIKYLNPDIKVSQKEYVELINIIYDSEPVADSIIKELTSGKVKNQSEYIEYIKELELINKNWLKSSSRITIENGDYKGATDVLKELNSLFKDKPEKFNSFINAHFDNLIRNKNADFKVMTAKLQQLQNSETLKEFIFSEKDANRINLDISIILGNNDPGILSKLEYILLTIEIKKTPVGSGDIKSLANKNITVEEFKEKYDYIDYITKGGCYLHELIAFANSALSYNEIRKIYNEHRELNPADLRDIGISVNSENISLFKKLLADKNFNTKYIASLLTSINENTDNRLLAEKLYADKDFPNDLIDGVVSYTNDSNRSLVEKLCADKNFPKDMIPDIAHYTNDSNRSLVEKLCADKNFPKDMIPGIAHYTNDSNRSLVEKLCADKNFPKDMIALIAGCISDDNRSLVEKLCADKNFPKDLIPDIALYTRESNKSLAEKLCADKDFPKEQIKDILQYTTANKDKIEQIEQIIDKPELNSWLKQNLKNGLEIDTIINLARTQNKLLAEETKAKMAAEAQAKKEEAKKVQEQKMANSAEIQADPKALDDITKSLVSLGVPEGMARNTYAKLCIDSNGNTDAVKLDAVKALIKTFGIEKTLNKQGKEKISVNILPKDIADIFKLATGDSLSDANGIFRIQMISDILILKQAGINDVKLATNIAAVKNMSSIEMKARLRGDIRQDLASRIDQLPPDVKENLKSQGINLDEIKTKALTEKSIDGKEVVREDVPTIKLRNYDAIVGTEKMAVDKYKTDPEVAEIWNNEEAFKAWAEKRYAKLCNWEENDYKSTKFANCNEAREKGLRKWVEFLNSDECNIKDDVFAKLLFIEGISSEMKPDNAYTPPAISKEVFETVYNKILEGNSKVSITKTYAEANRNEAIRQFGVKTVASDGTEGTWVRIPHCERGDAEYDKRIAMIQALAEGSAWCLRFDNAHNYFKHGDIHFFVDKNGKAQMAINVTPEGKIHEMQRRDKQDGTVPVQLANIVDEWATKNHITGREKAIKTALEAKPEFDRRKAKFISLQQQGDVIGIFRELGIQVDKLEDGTLSISEYKATITDKSYTLFDLGINEDFLMANVSEIRGRVNLQNSTLTKAPKLKRIGGKLNFGDNKINDLRLLETIDGKKISWEQPEAPITERLQSANTREDFIAIRDEIKKMPEGEEKQQLIQAYRTRYNQWSADPSRPDIRMQYRPEEPAVQKVQTPQKTGKPKLAAVVAKDAFVIVGTDKHGKTIKQLKPEIEEALHKVSDILCNKANKNKDDIATDMKNAGFAPEGYEFKYRAKSEQSMFDKLKNYLLEEGHENKTIQDAIKSVKDGVGCRTLVPDGNYANHPEVKALLAQGKIQEARIKAAELQSNEIFENLKAFIKKNKGKIKIIRLNNYKGKNGIPYLSELQLEALQELDKSLDIVLEVNKDDIKYQDKETTTKVRESGYTAFQMNFETTDGYVFEWQFRGNRVNEFAEGEHVPYDLRTGKDIISSHEELKGIYEPIRELLDPKKMSEEDYETYNKYLTAYYEYLRLNELGFPKDKPEFDNTKFDNRLRAENLIILHEYAEKIKKATSEEERLRLEEEYKKSLIVE